MSESILNLLLLLQQLGIILFSSLRSCHSGSSTSVSPSAWYPPLSNQRSSTCPPSWHPWVFPLFLLPGIFNTLCPTHPHSLLCTCPNHLNWSCRSDLLTLIYQRPGSLRVTWNILAVEWTLPDTDLWCFAWNLLELHFWGYSSSLLFSVYHHFWLVDQHLRVRLELKISQDLSPAVLNPVWWRLPSGLGDF